MGVPVAVHDDGPSIGWTDHARIYLRGDGAALPADELAVLLAHEAAHCLLLHGIRIRAMLRQYPDAPASIANLATDGEIALAIYDDDDEHIITRPRSLLAGGITRAWVHEHAPDCETMEEIFVHLLATPPPSSPGGFDAHLDPGDGDDSPGDASELIAAARAAHEQQKIEDIAAAAAENRQRDVGLSIQRATRGIAGISLLAAEFRRLAQRRRQRSYAAAPWALAKNILLPGVIRRRVTPDAVLFVDRSGSFSPDKTAAAEQLIARIAIKFPAVRYHRLYFSGCVSATDAGHDGTTNYLAVCRAIDEIAAQLAIVITDDDDCPAMASAHHVIVLPVGCAATQFAARIGAREIRL
jgi:hypothetical protein